MEVAAHWRREWAGTAEYGHFMKEGVSQRVARAMEILHASTPGANVRVMRAAYHSSSSGPGGGSASYMMQSTRKVFTSGFHLHDPSYNDKPLEITSLEPSSNYNNEDQNYKVTEPDDTEISEPSKWRNYGDTCTIQMSSEESSSADNSSIIDLDPHVNHNRRSSSYDTDSSDIRTVNKSISQLAPLDEAPLSTLKYKSLLNDRSSWRNNRNSMTKSESVFQHNDVFNENNRSDPSISSIIGNNKSIPALLSGSLNTSDRNNVQKARDGDINEHESFSLQAPGKVTIEVPIKVESQISTQSQTLSTYSDKKLKKVGFSKTELHFAAESGKVNIIPTDEKPSPVNNLRKRRSAFERLRGNFDKQITLFGDPISKHSTAEFDDDNDDEINNDESRNCTKSILKNKIPKPKPYFLGENENYNSEKCTHQKINESTPKSLRNVNKSRNNTDDIITDISSVVKSSSSATNHDTPWMKSNKGPTKDLQLQHEITSSGLESQRLKTKTSNMSLDRKLNYWEENRTSRDERKHDVEYKSNFKLTNKTEEGLRSVKLVRQVADVTESDKSESETNYYQNFPIKHNLARAPVPTPRLRSKFPTEFPYRSSVSHITDDITQKINRSTNNHQDEISLCSKLSKPKPSVTNFDAITSRSCDHISSSEKSQTNNKHNTNEFISKERKTDPERHFNRQCESLYVNIPVKKKEQESQKYLLHKSDQAIAGNKKQIVKCHNKLNSSEQVAENNNMKDSTNIINGRNKKPNTEESFQKPRKIINNLDVVEHTQNVNSLPKRKSKSLNKSQSNEISYNNKGSIEKASKNKTNEKILSSLSPERHYNVNTSSKQKVKSLNKIEFNEVTKLNSGSTDKAVQQNDRKSSSHSLEKHQNVDTLSKQKEKLLSKTEEYDITKNYKGAIEKAGHQKLNERISGAQKNQDHVPTTERNNSRSSKKSKIVINYDDKNGTVSSICKVKSKPSSKRKNVSKDKASNESYHNTRMSEKKNLRK